MFTLSRFAVVALKDNGTLGLKTAASLEEANQMVDLAIRAGWVVVAYQMPKR